MNKRRAEEERPEEAKKRRVALVTSEVEEETPVEEEIPVHKDDLSQSHPLIIEYKEKKAEEAKKRRVEGDKYVAEYYKLKVEEENLVVERSDFGKASMDDFCNDPLIIEYDKKMNDSKGYHAILLPYHLESINYIYAEYDDKILQEVSEAAINFFNQANQGSDFVFHSVVMGNWRHCAGKFYQITFRARPCNSNDVKEFEAQAVLSPWEKKKRVHVHECTVKPQLEYPVDFEQNELTEFSEEAIRFFNLNHEGSHFVLHSVVKGDYTPIVGSTFRITFTAKASNGEDIKEFEARVRRSCPWVKPSYIAAVECTIKEEGESSKAMVEEEFAVVERSEEKTVAERLYELTNTLFKEYEDKMYNSEGFYVVPLPPCLKVDVNILPEYDEGFLEELSELAIKFYNEAKGSDFVFHSLVMGNFNRCDGKFYRVTFRARPSKSNEIDDIKEFRARVSYCLWEKNPICVHDCTVKPEREYPLDFEHEELEEFSKDALKFYNRKHKESYFVLHSVVKGSNYTPISGYSVFVTFKTSNYGDVKNIKDFEAKLRLNFPWTQSRRATVLECDLKDDKAENLERPESESESESF